MANLDVSDVLLDPDFMSRGLTCTRTAVVVGDNGRSQKTVTSHIQRCSDNKQRFQYGSAGRWHAN